MGLRYFRIKNFYDSMNGVVRAKFAYPNVNFRYVVTPSTDLPTIVNPLVIKLINFIGYGC